MPGPSTGCSARGGCAGRAASPHLAAARRYLSSSLEKQPPAQKHGLLPPVPSPSCPCQEMPAGDARRSSKLPLPMKAASAKVEPPSPHFQGSAGCALEQMGSTNMATPAYLEPPRSESERVSWLRSKCQPAWEGFQRCTSSGQMAKVLFQPGESWLCEMCPAKPGHMVALVVENFMCIICLLWVTAGRSL